MTYRILVTGSRTWDDTEELRLALVRAATPHLPDVVLVHGGCPYGADTMAAQWAADMGIRLEDHPADWETFGKRAGFRRNAAMVELGADVCLAFIRDGSRSATHCADLAEQAGIPVRRYERGA